MNRTVVSGIAAFALLIGAGLAMNETTAEAGNCGGGLFSKLHAKKCGGGLLSGLKDRDRGCGGGGLLSGLKDRGCGGGGLLAGHFERKACDGGLLSRLKAKHASRGCSAPEPCCEAPAPEACGCEAPAPEACGCEAAPAPEACGCEAAPAPADCGCEAAPVAEAPCCGGEVEAAPVAAPCCGGGEVSLGSDAGYMDAGTVVEGGHVETMSSDAGYDLAPGETLIPGSVQTVGSEAAAPVSSSDAVAPAPEAAAPAAAEEAAPPAPTPDASTDA